MMANKREFYLTDDNWSEKLEEGVEHYTDMLFEAMWSTDEESIAETISGEPFCGCSACFWREALFFLVPKIIVGYKEGKIVLEE